MTKRDIGMREFEELSITFQLETLHRDGVYVGKKLVENDVVILFQLYSFYVEVYFEQYRRDVRFIKTSDSTDLLQPYLGQVHIRDLDKDPDFENE